MAEGKHLVDSSESLGIGKSVKKHQRSPNEQQSKNSGNVTVEKVDWKL